MIEISKGKQSLTMSGDKIDRLCVELAGGGYTVEQTAKAMEYRQHLMAGKTIIANGFTIKIAN